MECLSFQAHDNSPSESQFQWLKSKCRILPSMVMSYNEIKEKHNIMMMRSDDKYSKEMHERQVESILTVLKKGICLH